MRQSDLTSSHLSDPVTNWGLVLQVICERVLLRSGAATQVPALVSDDILHPRGLLTKVLSLKSGWPSDTKSAVSRSRSSKFGRLSHFEIPQIALFSLLRSEFHKAPEILVFDTSWLSPHRMAASTVIVSMSRGFR